MKILIINSFCGIGSTGRICTDLAQMLEKKGNNVIIAYGRKSVPDMYQKYAVRIGTEWLVRKNALSCRLFDNDGFTSKQATKKFLEWAGEYDPDVLYLHNLHGYYINIEMLFDWIKSRPNMQVKWTLHDCWAFTGHCAYFTMAKCDKWQTHCDKCVQKRSYPRSMLCDNCFRNYDSKKAAFCGVRNMTIITPSNWLAELVKKSFLKEYPVEVVYNDIDKNVFKPTPSNFREKYGLIDKKIVLGVASVWDERKGLNDFFKLREMLDESYAIVIVGLSKKQLKNLPKNIIGISRTNNVKELAGIYTAADVFVNPSKEETYGMTSKEAESCGTQAIVYSDTACAEVIDKSKSVAVKNVDGICDQIIKFTADAKVICGGVKIIVGFTKTDSPQNLAAIYSAADIFFNPTYEDNYPTVNLEAQACGTPVITYDTGGCKETLYVEDCSIVAVGDTLSAFRRIREIEENKMRFNTNMNRQTE